MTHPFSALGLPEPLVQSVIDMGYTDPTPVQIQAIPAVLQGRDILAAAQTGTGKTAAFALPLLAHMLSEPRDRKPKSVRALVLAPTRELAAQIDENVQAYASHTTLKSTLVFGGVNIRPQTSALAKGVDFLVATPGRLLDHIGQHNVSLTDIDFLVLDEADRMLDMGFIHDIRKILALIPSSRQTLLFSATFNDEIRALADKFLNDPVCVEIARNKESTLITQEAYTVPKKRKRELLRDLIVDNSWDQVLVFTRMKHTANRLSSQLEKDGINAAAIHGNKSQAARTKALAGFKDHTVRVLVATDIAARGLDIEGLPHVINYELPNVPEDYVHRIGRTGRAGLTGHAVSLVSPDEADLLRDIEKMLRRKIQTQVAQGYDGEVPEDIAQDEAQRDKARAEELRRLREAHRSQRSRSDERPRSNTRPARKPRAAAPSQSSAAPENETSAAERFERRPARSGTRGPRAAAPQSAAGTPRRQDADASVHSGARQRPVDDNFGNTVDYKPGRRGSNRARGTQWEPVDPFAPEHQALSLPQQMPDERAVNRTNFTRDEYGLKPHRSNTAGFGPRRAGPVRGKSADVKSTLAPKERTKGAGRRPSSSDDRYESVSSNLPPGMAMKFRRR